MTFTDTSGWVLNHYRYKQPLGQLFKPLFSKKASKTSSEWLKFLEHHGMLPIKDHFKKDWLNWRRTLNKRELENSMQHVKKDFAGPDADFFLFPLYNKNSVIMDELGGKNGCTFPGYILAFWHLDIPDQAIKALLLHEYHHLARLHHQNCSEHHMTLLDSMIMEGLAEWEVKSRIGETFTAPWTEKYSREQLKNLYEDIYRKALHIRGRQHHLSLLYGGSEGIPPLAGYQIGYDMVLNYIKHDTNFDSVSLLKKPSVQFLKGMYVEGERKR